MTLDETLSVDVPVTTPEEAGHKSEAIGSPPRPRWDRALFLYIPFAFVVSLTFGFQTDDSFITLRYAWNLVHGAGPVFNPGEHVQGYTSILHLLVATVAVLLPGSHQLLVLKLVSLGFGVLAIREGARLIEGLASQRWVCRTAYVVISTSWIVGFASGNALETTMEMWFLMVVARRLILDGPASSPMILGGFAFLAVMTRLDALAPLGCMALAGLVLESRVTWRYRISWFAGAIAACALTALFEYTYYGSVAPNTLYAKSLSLDFAVSQANSYLLQPFSSALLAEAIVLVGAAFTVLGMVSIATRHRRASYLLAAIVGQVLFIAKSGGDWMTGDRFLAPVIVPLLLVEVLGLAQLVKAFETHRGRHAGLNVAQIAVPLLVALSLLPLIVLRDPIWKITGVDNRSLLTATNFSYGPVWVGLPSTLSCLPRDDLVATSEVGFLGFSRPDLRILDLRGLTNRDIALHSLPATKTTAGVDDPHWYEPSGVDPVGAEILREHPAVIVELDTGPIPSPLGGAYRLVKVQSYGGIPVSFYVPAGATGDCPQPEGKPS